LQNGDLGTDLWACWGGKKRLNIDTNIPPLFIVSIFTFYIIVSIFKGRIFFSVRYSKKPKIFIVRYLFRGVPGWGENYFIYFAKYR